PSPRSSRFSRWLATATDRSRLRAAAEIDPRSSTRRNRAMSPMRSMGGPAMASAHGRAGAIDCQRFIESDCQFSRFEGDADKPSLRPHRSPAMTTTSPSRSRSPLALYALAAGAFGIGCAEFVIMGLLLQVAADLRVSLAAAG